MSDIKRWFRIHRGRFAGYRALIFNDGRMKLVRDLTHAELCEVINEGAIEDVTHLAYGADAKAPASHRGEAAGLTIIPGGAP